jgi:pyruvate dehydrogenase E2 component (dihydrolipoamide acetyltransferase)
MGLDIILPELPGGAATVLRWVVREGEAVAQGAPLAIVLTERAEVLLPAPALGTLREPVAAGSAVGSGATLGRLELQEGAESRERKAGSREQAGVAPQRRVLATPLARAIARGHDVELGAIAGSGAGGRVLARDVRAQLPAPSSQLPAPSSQLPLATATVEFDASVGLALVAVHQAEFARLRLPLGLTARVAEAAAALLLAHPLLNAAWGEEALLLRRRAHLAVAEPAGDGAGLRWALVRDAGDLTLRGVARAMARPAEPQGATFAVVSLAAGASWQSAAPPLPGTAAALSVGAAAPRAVAVGGALAVRPMATLTLSYDARVLDHCGAAAFLKALRAALERA